VVEPLSLYPPRASVADRIITSYSYGMCTSNRYGMFCGNCCSTVALHDLHTALTLPPGPAHTALQKRQLPVRRGQQDDFSDVMQEVQ